MKEKLGPRNVMTLAAADDGGSVVYFDQAKGAPKGFALRVSENSRAYYVTFRLHGEFVWYRVGDASQLSLSQARKAAKDTLAKVQLGRDPRQEREDDRKRAEESRSAGTLTLLARDWLTVREKDLRPKSVTYYRWLIDKKVAGSPLGRMKAAEVTAADVETRLADVRSKSGDVTANRLHQVLTTITGWARKKGKLQVNFMEAVDRPGTEEARDRVLSDAEIGCLLGALSPEPPVIAATVRLLLMLGQRATATIEGLLWSAVDLDAAIPTWTIAAEFQKNRRLHVVPLPPQAVTLITSLRRVTGKKDRVLEGVDQTNYNREWWSRIRDRSVDLGVEAELKVAHFTRHDLRRTCMTGMTKLGVTRFIADRVIGHAEQGVAGIYDRNDYLREKAAALAAWAVHLDQVERGEVGKGADILPMKERA